MTTGRSSAFCMAVLYQHHGRLNITKPTVLQCLLLQNTPCCKEWDTVPGTCPSSFASSLKLWKEQSCTVSHVKASAVLWNDPCYTSYSHCSEILCHRNRRYFSSNNKSCCDSPHESNLPCAVNLPAILGRQKQKRMQRGPAPAELTSFLGRFLSLSRARHSFFKHCMKSSNPDSCLSS